MARALSRGLAALALASLCWGIPAGAGAAQGQVPLSDVIQILRVGRMLVAVNANHSAALRVPLQVGESLLERRVRGIVGIALTNRRILAVSTHSGAWQEAAYRIPEHLTASPLLGDRLALIQTNLRVIGFDGGSGNLVERRLGPRERVVGWSVSTNVAVVVTDRRALGLSPFAGGFFAMPIGVHEAVQDLAATGNVASVTTSRRILTFRAPQGAWTSEPASIER